MNWNDAIARGDRIGRIDYVSPGDLVFLVNEHKGRLLAFTVTRIEHHQGLTTLWQSETRNYTIGGSSRLRFDFALRDEAAGWQDGEEA